MSVSVSLVEATRPEELTTAARNLGGKVAQLNSIIDAQRNALRDLQGGWEGEASQAALARAERDLAMQTGFRDRLAQAQQILQTGGTHLAQARSALLGIVSTLRGQGWQVSDNGIATPPPALPQVLKGTATAWTAIVQRLLTTFGEIDKQTAGSLPNFGPLSTDGPLFAGGDKKEERKPEDVGAEDSEALQNGELSQEQRERLIGNTTLTPDQQAALDNGTLTLPPEQMSYLQGFSRALGDKTPAEVKAIMDTAGPDGGRVADVFQLASNPNITTGLPGTQPPSTGAPSSGGKYALPDGIQRVLDGPVLTPLGIGEPIHHDNGSIGLPEVTTPSQPTSGLNDLADIIQRGNRDLQMGSDLDSGLFNKSQQLLEQSNGWPVPGNDPMSDRPRWYHQLVDPTLQNMFNAVNADDMVIHDAVTGSGGERFLNNLTQHQWQDDGLAAGGLFDWVGDSAAHDSSGRAAETAHALAEYTSSHSNQLLNLPDTDGQSLGLVNPELARDWARAFSPYMDDMVGMDTGDSIGPFEPLDPDGGKLEPLNTRHLMSVLYSDHPPLDQPVDANAPRTAGQIAMDSSRVHMSKMFDIAAHSVTDGTSGENNFAMKAAGKLQAAMDLGSYDERYDATHDAATAARESYDMRSRLFDLGKDLAAELPGGGVPAALGGFMKDFLIGPEPVMPGVENVQARDMFPVQMHMAATLAADGAGDPQLRADVQKYLVNGEFVIPEEGGKRDYARFYNDITSYLSTAGHDNVLNTMIDEYWRAYSGGITDATPPK
jgi:uncharacterized protein YukE